MLFGDRNGKEVQMGGYLHLCMAGPFCGQWELPVLSSIRGGIQKNPVNRKVGEDPTA